ncbi:ChrR family anti-sigma-E factor [Photobacterium sp. SDRW27]|uniref:ChrR family anti-sigma-E factor n=1 Tax=Photobacterium obscurum TaxID=2829490 RepID=UPI002244B980|nr:ChrR family anti-sigma-E factor [Photobacterium obscurum]MCW8328795.1 ChrR family anti-sigma-E factor [Photobacterium obscurum]
MTSIHFHPTNETLALYASGDLDSASSIMMSAHLEFCSHCRHRVADMEENLARELDLSTAEPLSNDMNAMLEKILAHSPEPQLETNEPTATYLELDNRRFHLPRVLQNHQDQIGPWTRLPGKIKRAHVSTAGQSKMNFIYMDCDSVLPQHTHQGQEITLVLAGEFMDEQATYRPGDFIIQTSEHKHSPKTRADQDCLCLTLLDAPLHFTSGLATLLNPFSQLFFR